MSKIKGGKKVKIKGGKKVKIKRGADEVQQNVTQETNNIVEDTSALKLSGRMTQ